MTRRRMTELRQGLDLVLMNVSDTAGGGMPSQVSEMASKSQTILASVTLQKQRYRTRSVGSIEPR
jgi:hypothetical protein